MTDNRIFDYNYFHIDSLPSEKRDQRLIRYLPRLLKALIIMFILWIFLWANLKFWYMIFANLFMIASLFMVVLALSKEKIEIAIHILLSTTILYVVFVCIIISGPGGPNLGSIHYWLFAIIVVAHFAFTNNVYKRVFYTIVSLVIIFIVEYALFPFKPIYSLSAEITLWAHIVTVLSVVLFIGLLLHLLVNDYNSAEKSLNDSNERMEELLFNMLPPKIAKRLTKDGQTFADGFVECSILFADLVGFTTWANEKQPEEVVRKLNHLFSKFDDLCDEFQIEKIKTIGDAYMVAAGVPEEDPHHAYNIIKFALKMKQIIKKESFLNLRIGINSGVVVAGIIGKKRFLYDLWGDSVNVASRMESSGITGEIQISEMTYEKVKHYNIFDFTNKRSVYIKGKGDMTTYLIKKKSISLPSPYITNSTF